MFIKFIISHNIPIYSIFANISSIKFTISIGEIQKFSTQSIVIEICVSNAHFMRWRLQSTHFRADLPSPPLPRTSTYRASSSPLFLETSLAGRETTDGQEEEKEDEPLVKVQLTHVEHGEREREEDGEAGDNEEESGIPAPGRRIHRGLIGNERAEKSRKKLPTRMMKTLEN